MLRFIGFVVVTGALVLGAASFLGLIDVSGNLDVTRKGQHQLDESVDKANDALKKLKAQVEENVD